MAGHDETPMRDSAANRDDTDQALIRLQQALVQVQKAHSQLQAEHSTLLNEHMNTVNSHNAQINAKDKIINNLHHDRNRAITQASEFRLGEEAQKEYHKVKRENEALKAEHLGDASAFDNVSNTALHYEGKFLQERRARQIAEDDRKAAYDRANDSHADQFELIDEVRTLQDYMKSLEQDKVSMQEQLNKTAWDLDRANDHIAYVEGRQSQTMKEMNDSNKEIAQLKADLRVVEEDFSQLEQDNEALKNLASNLQDQLQAARGTIPLLVTTHKTSNTTHFGGAASIAHGASVIVNPVPSLTPPSSVFALPLRSGPKRKFNE